MELYVVIDNNHEKNDWYEEWVAGIFSTEEDAKECMQDCIEYYIQEETEWLGDSEEDIDNYRYKCDLLPVRIDTITLDRNRFKERKTLDKYK